MDWLEKELTKAYEIKTQKVGKYIGYNNHGKVLNSVLRVTEDGWEMEADPRHAELVVDQLGRQRRQRHRHPEIVGRGRGRQ